MLLILPPSYIMWLNWVCHVCQCTILNLNIFNNLLKKIMKIWYFENIYGDESKTILYAIFGLYIWVKNRVKTCHMNITHF